MTALRRILFVCTGNVCRSALAEHLLKHRLAAEGLRGVEVRSAGVAAHRGMTSPEEVLRVLARHGAGSGGGHKAQLLTGKLVDWADVILAMETRHLEASTSQFPEAAGKTHLLKAYAGLAGTPDIEDPMGRPQDAYDRCSVEILEALEALVAKIKSGK